ncbi:hypothetical protein HK096_001063, partial [Nowakowskiella sp. JEL0078]
WGNLIDVAFANKIDKRADFDFNGVFDLHSNGSIVKNINSQKLQAAGNSIKRRIRNLRIANPGMKRRAAIVAQMSIQMMVLKKYSFSLIYATDSLKGKTKCVPAGSGSKCGFSNLYTIIQASPSLANIATCHGSDVTWDAWNCNQWGCASLYFHKICGYYDYTGLKYIGVDVNYQATFDGEWAARDAFARGVIETANGIGESQAVSKLGCMKYSYANSAQGSCVESGYYWEHHIPKSVRVTQRLESFGGSLLNDGSYTLSSVDYGNLDCTFLLGLLKNVIGVFSGNYASIFGLIGAASC